MEFALDSKVFSFGASADFFDSCVSMKREFFGIGAGVGIMFTIVSSAGFSSNSGSGATFPLNVASEKATRR